MLHPNINYSQLLDYLTFSINVYNYGPEYDFYVKNLLIQDRAVNSSRVLQLGASSQKYLQGTLVLNQYVLLPDQQFCVSFRHSLLFQAEGSGTPLNSADGHCVVLSAFAGSDVQRDSAYYSRLLLLVALIVAAGLLIMSVFFETQFLKPVQAF